MSPRSKRSSSKAYARELTRELMIFHEIGKAVNSTLELKEVLKIILDRLDELFNPRILALFLVEQERKRLRLEILKGMKKNLVQEAYIPLGYGITGWVAEKGKAVNLSETSQDQRYDNLLNIFLGFTPGPVLAVPVKSREKILGVILLMNEKSEEKFRDQDLFLVSTFADYCAIAIENSRNLKTIQDLSITDTESGVFNSRFLFQFLERELKRAKRYGGKVALIYLDVDYFRYINDGYGHQAGSNLLLELGSLLKNSLRDVDLVARYEADEFILVLPETGKPDANLTAQRLRQAIKNKEFHPAKNLTLKITVSMGISSFPEDAKNISELIREADQAMFQAKEAGRDRIVITKS